MRAPSPRPAIIRRAAARPPQEWWTRIDTDRFSTRAGAGPPHRAHSVTTPGIVPAGIVTCAEKDPEPRARVESKVYDPPGDALARLFSDGADDSPTGAPPARSIPRDTTSPGAHPAPRNVMLPPGTATGDEATSDPATTPAVLDEPATPATPAVPDAPPSYPPRPEPPPPNRGSTTITAAAPAAPATPATILRRARRCRARRRNSTNAGRLDAPVDRKSVV